ncbi:protein angel homolog 2 isoform X2 [Carettochelys insculpta]|uniref:protein angel homolog 2 isoform X2 n=1 Tax=Carettochelys insculpta TaxID=44489 RepID=UPI003EB7D611
MCKSLWFQVLGVAAGGAAFERHPMLPHHVQRLGRDCIAHWDIPRRFCWNSHLSNYIRWAGHYSWAPYPRTGVTVNWRPPNFLGSWRLPHFLGPWRPPHNWNWQPDNITQNSFFHLSHPNMESEGDEPPSKRRRRSGQHDICSPNEEISSCNLNEAACLSTLSKNKEENTANIRGMVKRHWEYFCHQSKKMKILEDKQVDQNNTEDKGKFDFTVMSYNILSQNLLEDNSHLYKHCRQPVLIWGYRFPNILREIQQLDADVLCLQEVQEDHYEMQIKPSLESLGYHCEYKMRTGKKPDGCAVCFRISKFNLISSNPVEFFRHDIPLLDRDNVGLVLLLQPRFHCKTTAAVCVANTHLLYNPRRGDIKLTQLAMLLAEIASVAHRKDGRFCPIIICGDFNSVPGSPLYSFLKEGNLNYEGLSIGKVSGQEQSPRGQRILTIPIWPPSLGISQNCVYEAQQQQEENTGGKIKEAKLENTEELVIAAEKFPSKLQHHFKLSSVYSHYSPESGIPEVTTCHSRSAVTVDYIFYSAAKDDSTAQPVNLLLAGIVVVHPLKNTCSGLHGLFYQMLCHFHGHHDGLDYKIQEVEDP